jgi:hypothetical protein
MRTKKLRWNRDDRSLCSPGRVTTLGLATVLVFMLLMPELSFCADKNQATQPLQFSKNKDIAQIKPHKPVRIKLHRGAKGEYQWDITGDNADEIVKADRRLRKLLEAE